jgi:HSP20 family protein
MSELPTTKKASETTPERTFAGKTFTPATDIFESKAALTLVMDMPGVRKDSVHVRLENDILEVEGQIEPTSYQGRQAIYSEYNVGNFYRRFTVSNRIARDHIEAKMADGVLTLSLPKVPEATPRRITVH